MRGRRDGSRRSSRRSSGGRGAGSSRAGGGARGARGGRGRGARGGGPRKVSARRPAASSSSARDSASADPLVRLNKYLADHGIASRRACDLLIEQGKVTIDGMPVSELGTKVNPFEQTVEVDGTPLRPEGASRRYYLLHKPAGVVCTNERSENRPRAIDLITDRDKGRIYTVGRLDEESTGLILLTNDGEFAQRVAHPRYGVPKTYRVTLHGRIHDEAVQKVRDGVYLSDGRTGGARILIRRRSASSSVLLVTLREGRNREVRRVFADVGFKVVGLARVDIGPLSARGLRAGKWRPLSREEVEALLDLADEEQALEPLDTPRQRQVSRLESAEELEEEWTPGGPSRGGSPRGHRPRTEPKGEDEPRRGDGDGGGGGGGSRRSSSPRRSSRRGSGGPRRRGGGGPRGRGGPRRGSSRRGGASSDRGRRGR